MQPSPGQHDVPGGTTLPPCDPSLKTWASVVGEEGAFESTNDNTGQMSRERLPR